MILYSRSSLTNLLGIFVDRVSSGRNLVVLFELGDELFYLVSLCAGEHLIVQTMFRTVGFEIEYLLNGKMVDVNINVGLNIIVNLVLTRKVDVDGSLQRLVIEVSEVFVVFKGNLELKTLNANITFDYLGLLGVELLKMHFKGVGFKTRLYNSVHHVR